MNEEISKAIDAYGIESVLVAIEVHCCNAVLRYHRVDHKLETNWAKLDKLTFAVRQAAHVMQLN